MDFDTDKRYFLLKCPSCFIVHTFPRLNKHELRNKYSEYREEENGGRFLFMFDNLITKWHLRRPRAVTKILKRRGKVLDVGCGRGTELSFFKQDGWKVVGTELRDHHYSFPVYTKDIWKLKFRPGIFDVVMFLHSLEHMIFPSKALNASRVLLKKGGLLLVAVPNYSSLERKIFGKNWFHLDIPRHYSHFDESFFRKWAKVYKFKIINESHVAPEYDLYSVLQSTLNILPFPKNLLYNFLLVKKRLSGRQRLLLLLQLPFTFVFLPILLLVPLLWLTKQAGTIELVLMKE